MNKWIIPLLLTVLLSACNTQPTPVANVVEDFEAKRYLGKWYEIVRMPLSFEEGLQSVTAEYRLNGDGTLEVTNRGYHVENEEWQTAIGLAKPVENMEAAYKLTFFWPFYGGYYVSWLDDNYQLAIVTSDSHEYFWLLSRTPDVAQDDIDYALAKAHEWGYDIDQMIMVDHPAEFQDAN